jgi:hypothetical protein
MTLKPTFRLRYNRNGSISLLYRGRVVFKTRDPRAIARFVADVQEVRNDTWC